MLNWDRSEKNNMSIRQSVMLSTKNMNLNQDSVNQSSYLNMSQSRDKLVLKQNMQIQSNLREIHRQEVRKTFLRMTKANDIGSKIKPVTEFKALNGEEGPISFEMYVGHVFEKKLNVTEFEIEWAQKICEFEETILCLTEPEDMGLLCSARQEWYHIHQ